MSYELIEKLKQEIAGYKDTAAWEEVGRIIEVGDGIARIFGLNNAFQQELLTIETTGGTPVTALALNLEDDAIGALILGNESAVKSGDTVKRTKNLLSVAAGDELLGRVIDPLGTPLDKRGDPFAEKTETKRVPLEQRAPSVLEREPVNTPLHSGIKAIDAMIPIGRGQRELIIGDRQTGKTALVLDTIINQAKEPEDTRPICIYVAIGQKQAKIARLVETLKQHDALSYTIVVSAAASSPAAQWYLAPFTGCAVGEYFRDQGRDAVVVYDDLSKHAWAYRQISLLLRRPPGREAYPGDIFYLHSRLLERAAKLSQKKGGGSLTALPIIETQLGDVTAYIPTNVISITDGQIYLESDLFYQGVRPAVNVGLSVSRVGSSAQTKAMKQVAGKLRLALAQFRELQAFVQFSADVDDATKKKIQHGQVVTEVLKQADLSPMAFEKQVVILYAALNDYFDAFSADTIKKRAEDFIVYIEQFHQQDVLDRIKAEGNLDEATEAKLKEAIHAFLQRHNPENTL